MSIAYGTHIHQNATINSAEANVSNSTMLDNASKDPILNIHVSCENVIQLDLGSPSDPMCVLFVPVNGKYCEVARTEVIWDDPNPNWVKFFQAMYVFETHQPLRFCVYDCDSENADLSKHDFVGYADTDVQTLVSNGTSQLRLELKHNTATNKRGTLIITTEQATQSGSIVTGSISCMDLRKLHFFSRDNPYVLISKPSESGKKLPIFRSEVVFRSQTCTFKNFEIPLQTICNGDTEMPITISIMNFVRNRPDEFIGSVERSISQLMESQRTPIEISFTDNKRQKVKSGQIRFNSLQLVRKPTFWDYMRSGIQLNMITAIDYTASNRDPRDPMSLHFLRNDGIMNQYEQCIYSVGSVLCPYDSDQQFPVYGFGGKLNGIINHCFPLTFDPNNPNVSGLNGILSAYRQSLTCVQLSGPTLFSPVIKAATGVAIQSWNESKTYTILMILTDGIINDMQETINAIVEATDAPLSIIIVGVGNANFSAMDQLDADEVPLVSSTGVRMKRDIVQFVPFVKFQNNGNIGLAAEVLAEVPRQVDEFCRSHGYVPNIQE
ncbi:Copine family protein [Histomonas meleagridis]|uniref:Copine family protein n=1 Tax=Histomonas meleagridis TaxID=135588 RepID=UPI00355A4572|nr:Copine family protein [Histomonas meleagridis]KAH0806912.1 Copine family protein [Histomonas meleagridis]